MTAAYNEIDPFAAAWLRELIKAGHIAPGEVLECSIEDLTPNDLKPFHQVHLFAGIGVWSYALRRIGWPDDRRIWTASCPCQPFSAAGKSGGFDDERHLWPAVHYLAAVCRPPIIVGEQVASKDGLGWLDLVQADLEGAGYASGAVDTCAAGFGAPHIRQRLYWAAKRLDDTAGARHVWPLRDAESNPRDEARLRMSGAGEQVGGMADSTSVGREQRRAEPSGRSAASGRSLDRLDDDDDARLEGQRGGYPATLGYGQGSVRPVAEAGEFGGVADAVSAERPDGQPGKRVEHDAGGRLKSPAASTGLCSGMRPGPTNGHWRDADWLFCRDGKWRAVEPGAFPLAHGAPARMVVTCSCCKTETRWVNGTPSKADTLEVLQTMQFENDEEAPTFGKSGGAEFVQPPAILQRSMLWDVFSEDPEDKRRGAYPGKTDRETAFLQSVWRVRVAAGSPQGPQPLQQHADKFGSPVYTMPPSGALQADPEIYMRGLRALVLCAQPSEPEQNLFCPVCEDLRAHQCAQTMASRVGELRGYGNAIVAPQAEAFLRAALLDDHVI